MAMFAASVSTYPAEMTIDSKLRTLCDQHRTNPTELGRIIGGVSRTTMNNWANGVSKPDLSSALKISRHFGVPLEYLADDSLDEPPPPPPLALGLAADESHVLEAYRSMRDGPEPIDHREAFRRLTRTGPVVVQYLGPVDPRSR